SWNTSGEEDILSLPGRANSLPLALRRPPVANRFGGRDQAPADGRSAMPQRVERSILIMPASQPRKGRLIDLKSPRHLGQGETRLLNATRPIDVPHPI